MFSNSFNVVRNNDPALADALQTISGAVEKSGNKEAGLAWERFMKQAVGERDKTILSALWDRVVKLVPDVTKLIERSPKSPRFLPNPCCTAIERERFELR
jgi:hypothetical protein